MKRISILLLISFLTVSLFAQTKIIFDADIDTDCDDGGALAVLHALADKGEVEILATVVSTRYPYSAPCVEAINRYYGRPDIPIGAPKTTWADTGSRGSAYAEHISKEYVTTLNNNDDAPDAVRVYRQILANQESNSVVILTIGYLTNIRDLLESGPDDISPLSGVELITQKVSRWVQTGAAYPSDYNAAVRGNYTPDPTSAHIAFRDWPEESVPMYISGEGSDIHTGSLLPGTPTNNPVRRIYELRVGLGNTRDSWDQIGTLFAVRPNDARWTFRTNGYYYIFWNGTYEWRTTPDKNHTVLEYNTSLNAELRQTLDQLMIQPPGFTDQKIEKLSIASNNRVLKKESGAPFFPIADTAWKIAYKLNQQDVLDYLQIRKEQKFNTIALVAFPMDGVVANVYGKQPFEIVSGKYDPLQPIINTNEYDYWDHLDFVISSAQKKGLYVTLLPAWGSRIAGDWGDGHPTSDVILNIGNASNYASWISHRFKDYTNIIWMIGGDRSAVYDSYDYRPEFRAMAAGVLAGLNPQTALMSYHPRKWKPNSSEWFHNDNWLNFNSIQDQPSDQINAVRHDYALSPTKPTWLFEGGYEERSGYGEWQVRFQGYQTVFAGGFGYTYGHMSIWDFDSDWKTKMQAPGANDMRHLSTLMSSMTNNQFFTLIPDQSLIDGDTGSMTGSEGIYSTCIVAMRTVSGDYAMIYSANGRNIRVKMDQLTNSPMRAIWFNPRSGLVTLDSTNVLSGSGAPIIEFNPPGDTANGNDYVLVMEPEPEPVPDFPPELFDDSYTVSGSGDINYEYDTRQSGALTPVSYLPTTDFTVTDSGANAGKAYAITTGHDTKYLSLDHNFTESGDYSVECEMTRYSDDGGAYITMAIGTDAVNSDPEQPGINGFKIRIWNDGGYQIYLNGVRIYTGSDDELQFIVNPTLKVKLVVSQLNFDGIGNGYIALFINNKAYLLSDDHYTIINPVEFINNFINCSVDHYDVGVSVEGAIDNLKITTPVNAITTAAWTDDASSGINSSKTYTHAINIAASADVVINGQTFTGVGEETSGSDWQIIDGGGSFTFAYGSIANVNVSVESGNLLVNFIWPSGNTGPSFTLTGLIPGLEYIFTAYNRGYNNTNGDHERINYLATSDGAAIASINQTEFGIGNGQLVTYRYTADDDGVFTISMTRGYGTSSGTWHAYAFSNEEVIPEPGMILGGIAVGLLAFCRKQIF